MNFASYFLRRLLFSSPYSQKILIEVPCQSSGFGKERMLFWSWVTCTVLTNMISFPKVLKCSVLCTKCIWVQSVFLSLKLLGMGKTAWNLEQKAIAKLSKHKWQSIIPHLTMRYWEKAEHLVLWSSWTLISEAKNVVSFFLLI